MSAATVPSNGRAATAALRVLGYVRVSTDEQADSGAGLAAQRAAIEAEAARRGWTIEFLEDAGRSAKDLRRPGIESALARLAAGEADALCVSKLDRLSRSTLDFARLIEQAQREGWALVALDSPVDMSSAYGEAMASIQATFAQLERRLISERTKAALAAKRAAGVRLGRPPAGSATTRRRARKLRASGMKLHEVVAALEAEGHTAPTGGRLHLTTVARMVRP